MHKIIQNNTFHHFISTERYNTYVLKYPNKFPEGADEETIKASSQQNALKAFQLYLWNVRMSGALLQVLGSYEVILRNAIMKTFDYVYYRHSIFDNQFIASLNIKAANSFMESVNSLLPQDVVPYSLFNEETNVRKKSINISGIPKNELITKLKFSFWEHLLTKNYGSIWKNNYRRAFPHMSSNEEVSIVHQITKSMRVLRNRACHNKPIFSTDIDEVLSNIKIVLEYIEPDLIDIFEDFSRDCLLLKQERIDKAF